MGKNRELTQNEIESIALELKEGNSKKKKAAIKKIGKLAIKELSDDLFESYTNLVKSDKNWEIQAEMIKSLGIIKASKISPFLEDIIKENLDDDMITFEASKALIRIKNQNTEEIVSAILDVLKTGSKSAKDGAVALLSCDAIIPCEKDMRLLIELIDNDTFDDDLDYREYLISAMANWSSEISRPFFEKFKNDNRINEDVIKYAEKGKLYYLDW